MFEKELEEYKNQPKWKGKIFMKIERKLNKTEKQSDFLNTQIDSAEEFIEKDYLKS